MAMSHKSGACGRLNKRTNEHEGENVMEQAGAYDDVTVLQIPTVKL